MAVLLAATDRHLYKDQGEWVPVTFQIPSVILDEIKKQGEIAPVVRRRLYWAILKWDLIEKSTRLLTPVDKRDASRISVRVPQSFVDFMDSSGVTRSLFLQGAIEDALAVFR